jgi:radical SAM superfamily enzyme YgiQ (UPF0313 family)
MELTVRKGADTFLPEGAFRRLTEGLRRHAPALGDIPAVVISCCDARTRMLPFVIYDRYIFPAGPRIIAAALHDAGFARTRAVFQLWNPNVRPSQARLDGRPPQLLLVSSLAIHSRTACRVIGDAWRLGDDRPLIIAGGPKAIYQPYELWPLKGPRGPVGPDVAVTGEAYVLLDLLNVLVEFRRPGEGLRPAFERARHAGALDGVPGLVYLAPGASLAEPALVDTGLQRLMPNFDELPEDVVGLRLLERPHGGTGLSPAPIPAARLRRIAPIVPLQMTQGCKFSCSYCPIPAVNQKTWRWRSPEGIARQMRSIHEEFGIKFFFGSDDNFFNRRQTAEEILTALAEATTSTGRRLGNRVRWGTEATQHDTYKNRDLLPLARQAGLYSLWFGIEDLTATLVNKGQKLEVTPELFRLMHANRIAPMAMIMYHDGQPFHTPDSLYGLSNQVRFLREAGAISLQCTVHTPSIGTREWEKTFEGGGVLARVGGQAVGDPEYDGNHVIVRGREPHWVRQVKWLGAYATFYNPLNLLRALRRDGSPLWKLRLGYQAIGMAATLWTVVRTVPFLMRLALGRRRYHAGPPAAMPVPVELAPQALSRLPVTVPLPRRPGAADRPVAA